MTAAYESPITPELALPLIMNRLHRLTIAFRSDDKTTAGDLALIGIVEDLVNVVAQLAGAVTS